LFWWYLSPLFEFANSIFLQQNQHSPAEYGNETSTDKMKL